MRLAANLTLLFGDMTPLKRPNAAALAGFDGVEVLFPYDHAVADWQAALGGLPLALINTPPGDWAGGERGFAAVPGQQARFRAGFEQALDYAHGLGAGRVHVMAGNATGPAAADCLRANLDWALEQAQGLPLTLEPLNLGDMPGYFLNDFDQAAALIRAIGHPGLGLQFDLWHASRIHGDAQAVWNRVAPLVHHIQIAGLDARAEPCAAAQSLARQMQADGYAGWFAAEYRPTEAGMGWLAAWRA